MPHRTLLLVPLLLSGLLPVACSPSPPPQAPAKKTVGVCDDGALVGKASERGASECDPGNACVLDDQGPRCVARAGLADLEPCGALACGTGCSCASVAESTCLCPTIPVASSDAGAAE